MSEKKHTKPPKGVSQETEKPENKKIAELTAKVQELTALSQRLQADFENYKKKVEKDKKDVCQYANVEVICKILSVLDSFELGLKNKDQKDFVKGVELIYSQLFDLLEKYGLRKIDALGKKFNPHYHDVLLQEESDKEQGIIIEELQKGYMIHDKVLRTSKVKISKKTTT